MCCALLCAVLLEEAGAREAAALFCAVVKTACLRGFEVPLAMLCEEGVSASSLQPLALVRPRERRRGAVFRSFCGSSRWIA